MSTVADSVSKTVLKAVIIYDDFDSATRAMALLERVAVHPDVATKWDIKPWRFDVLKKPALAALTVAVAANADLIVLALKCVRSTPNELLGWLKKWAEYRRVEDAALLALPSGDAEAPSVPWNELRGFAEEHGLIFLDNDNVGDDGKSAPLGGRWHRRSATPGPARMVAGRQPLPLR
jgi:hypothetical protein